MKSKFKIENDLQAKLKMDNTKAASLILIQKLTKDLVELGYNIDEVLKYISENIK